MAISYDSNPGPVSVGWTDTQRGITLTGSDVQKHQLAHVTLYGGEFTARQAIDAGTRAFKVKDGIHYYYKKNSGVLVRKKLGASPLEQGVKSVAGTVTEIARFAACTQPGVGQTSLCKTSSETIPSSGASIPLVPIVLGGAGLVVLLLVMKRKA